MSGGCFSGTGPDDWTCRDTHCIHKMRGSIQTAITTCGCGLQPMVVNPVYAKTGKYWILTVVRFDCQLTVSSLRYRVLTVQTNGLTLVHVNKCAYIGVKKWPARLGRSYSVYLRGVTVKTTLAPGAVAIGSIFSIRVCTMHSLHLRFSDFTVTLPPFPSGAITATSIV